MKSVFKLVFSVVLMGVVALAGVSSVSAMTLQEGASAARCDGCPSDLFGDAETCLGGGAVGHHQAVEAGVGNVFKQRHDAGRKTGSEDSAVIIFSRM